MTKTVNYTPEQVAMLHAEPTPITYARANELAEAMGKTAASVRAKILSEQPIQSPPVFNGLITAGGKFFVADTKGRIICYE